MNNKIWKHFRLSKYKFPSFQIQGSGSTKGANVIGRTAARRELEKSFDSSRVEKMRQSDTFREWIFSETLTEFRKNKKRKAVSTLSSLADLDEHVLE